MKKFVFVSLLCLFIFSCTKEELRPKNVILLMFDGYHMPPNAWSDTSVYLEPSGLNAEDRQRILDSVQKDLEGAILTADERFFNACTGHRQRVVLTVTSFRTGVGGISLRRSFVHPADNPAFVFTAALKYNTQLIRIATSHEIGHTYGLFHQRDNGIMNASYYTPGFVHWSKGINVINNYQDDKKIIDSTNTE